MAGMVGCLSAMFFGILLMGIVLTMFSIAAVEILHPLNVIISDDGGYPGCDRCHRAFSTVQSTTLTFFATVLAGDSWSDVGIPLLEANPLMAFPILIGVFMTCQIGMMNVITAVVVEQQARAHEEDVNLRAALKSEMESRSYSSLMSLFTSLDEDHSDHISLEELVDSFDNNDKFREVMDCVDIKREDLPMLFQMFDIDSSGSVLCEEFVSGLHQFKSMDVRTLLFFTKYDVGSAKEAATESNDQIRRKLFNLEDTLADMSRRLEILVPSEEQFERNRSRNSENVDEDILGQQSSEAGPKDEADDIAASLHDVTLEEFTNGDSQKFDLQADIRSDLLYSSCYVEVHTAHKRLVEALSAAEAQFRNASNKDGCEGHSPAPRKSPPLQVLPDAPCSPRSNFSSTGEGIDFQGHHSVLQHAYFREGCPPSQSIQVLPRGHRPKMHGVVRV